MVMILDLETTGLDPHADDAAILMVGWLDTESGTPTVLHLASKHPDPEVWIPRLQKHLAGFPPVLGHNIKFDLKWLKRFGVELEPAGDTMVIAHLVDENRSLGLKSLMADELGDWSWDGPWDASDPAGMAKYLVKDLCATHMLWRREEPKLTKAQRALYAKVLVPAIGHLVTTELAGLHVPAEALRRAQAATRRARDAVLDQLDPLIPPVDEWPPGINEPAWGSTNWQRWFLFEHLGIKPHSRGKPTNMFPSGAPSTSAAAMAHIDHPVGKLVVELAKVQKQQTGFITPYLAQLRDDTLYTSFNLTGTVTGRLSSGAVAKGIGVNLQQVPKDKVVKPVFQAPPGYMFMEADYSQLELRVAAVMAQERRMLELYDQGRDIHSWMVGRLLGKTKDVTELERRTAKAVNFGFLYGMYPKLFMQVAKQQYGLDIGPAEAERFRDSYFQAFPGLAGWHRTVVAKAYALGHASTLFGRRRHLPGLYSDDRMTRSAAERQAINAPVQGTGSDIALYAYARLGAEGKHWRCVGLVHDALLFYVREDKAEKVARMLKQEMERPLPRFNCPLVVDVTWGPHWGARTHEL